MNRTAKNVTAPYVKPVEKIELSEKNIRRRVIIVIALIAVAAVSLSCFVSGLIRKNNGWRDIEVNTQGSETCASEFVLSYDLGSGGISATAEYKQIAAVYTEAAEYAYRLFNENTEFDGMNNVRSINTHVNETVKVDDTLYKALELMEEKGGRKLYLAPVYGEYKSLFGSADDTEAAYYDPSASNETAEFFDEVTDYICSPEHIRLELVGDGQVCLKVSDEYLAFAEEYGFDSFIDFFWLKNAFIADYLAGVMEDNGFTRGTISSCDGFIRCLDDRGTQYSVSVTDKKGLTVYPAARADYRGPMSLVCMRNHMLSPMDVLRYYEYENGEVRNSYIDETDGLCKCAVSELWGYSGTETCAKIALSAADVCIADEFDASKLSELPDDVDVIYSRDSTVYYSGSGIELNELYSGDDLSYQKERIG